uniref:Uncharacterized protein n=1 Tax=Cacopsylla melanoneura TaxID=428564 RepID=A0A8D8V746_9HEMI
MNLYTIKLFSLREQQLRKQQVRRPQNIRTSSTKATFSNHWPLKLLVPGVQEPNSLLKLWTKNLQHCPEKEIFELPSTKALNCHSTRQCCLCQRHIAPSICPGRS